MGRWGDGTVANLMAGFLSPCPRVAASPRRLSPLAASPRLSSAPYLSLPEKADDFYLAARRRPERAPAAGVAIGGIGAMFEQGLDDFGVAFRSRFHQRRPAGAVRRIRVGAAP